MVHYQHDTSDIEKQLNWVWYNSTIFDDKLGHFFSESLFHAGLWYIKDVFDQFDKVIPFNTWLKRGALPRDYLIWRRIVWATKNKYNFSKLPQENSQVENVQNFMGIMVENRKVPLNKMHSKDLKSYYVQEVLKDQKKRKKIYKH